MKKSKDIILKHNPEKPIPTEIIADNIVHISQAMKKIDEGRLSRRAIILLIKDQAPSCAIGAIEEVLRALRDLERIYVR